MTRPRSALISLTDTPWHHVVNRCVRRALLPINSPCKNQGQLFSFGEPIRWQLRNTSH